MCVCVCVCEREIDMFQSSKGKKEMEIKKINCYSLLDFAFAAAGNRRLHG